MKKLEKIYTNTVKGQQYYDIPDDLVERIHISYNKVTDHKPRLVIDIGEEAEGFDGVIEIAYTKEE